MAKEKKEKKPVTRGSAVRLTTILTIVAVICLALLIAVPILANMFDGVLRDFMGEAGRFSNNGEFDYYELDYETYDELEVAEKQYVRDAAGESYVLLKNEDDALPLKTSKDDPTEVALFSQSCTDFVVGGSGSGGSSSDVSMRDAFESVGYKVNSNLWNYYKNTSSHERGGSASFSGSGDWALDEAPLSELQSKVTDFNSISQTATPIFIMSRTGGEGADEPRYMGGYGATAEDEAKSYLEPDSVELEILDYLNKNFSKVILVLNTNNVMETGWIDDYENIKAVLWVPGGGDQAAYALADVLCGNANPSGHLVDTMAYSNFSSPAMQNMGDFRYTRNGGSTTSYYGVSYDEGIYVGYKYYETRYYDAVMGQGSATSSVGSIDGSAWDYAKEVAHPFGYGRSYTDFTWSDFSVRENSGDTFTVTVEVENTGDVAGKDVVEVYLNAPYTDYDKANYVEKSAVTLVGFGKTEIIEPGKSEKVEITVDKSDFCSYDDVGYKTYILEGGSYLLTAATDAHAATNNFLAYEGESTGTGSAMTADGDTNFVYAYKQQSDDTTTYATSKVGAKVTNRFETAAASTASTITTNCNYIDRDKYLTRNDWQSSWPKTHGNQDDQAATKLDEVNGYQYREEISNTLYAKLQESGSASAANNPTDDSTITSEMAGSYDVDGDLELIDYRGLDYDDSAWDALISQMTTKEAEDIINLSGYQTPAAASIAKPMTQDRDGPAQLQNMVQGSSYDIAYLSDVAVGATWNSEVAYLHGHYISQDGLLLDAANGWYGPAMNIHRTPFAGRNFEYYSEDGFISGVMARSAVTGAAENGMYSCIKHFALNDQESNRDSNGLATWCNEQAMREIYLRPFQMVSEAGTVTENYYERTLVVDDDGLPVLDEEGEYTYDAVAKTAEIPVMQALMTSFNRVGATWAGGSYQLVQEILRGEWGFNGYVVTDYSQGATSYMHAVQMLRAGADTQLTQFTLTRYSLSGDAEIYYTKEAMHHVLYTVVNSNAMEGYAGKLTSPFAYYVIVEIIFEIVFAAGIILCVAFTIHRWMRYRKDENGGYDGSDDARDAHDASDTLNL